jgi:hypothetical protein
VVCNEDTSAKGVVSVTGMETRNSNDTEEQLSVKFHPTLKPLTIDSVVMIAGANKTVPQSSPVHPSKQSHTNSSVQVPITHAGSHPAGDGLGIIEVDESELGIIEEDGNGLDIIEEDRNSMDDDCTLSTLVVSVDTDPTEKLLLDGLTLSTILDDSCTTEVCVILGVEISVEDIPPSVAVTVGLGVIEGDWELADDDCTSSNLVISADTDPTERLLLDVLTLSTILDTSPTVDCTPLEGVTSADNVAISV